MLNEQQTVLSPTVDYRNVSTGGIFVMVLNYVGKMIFLFITCGLEFLEGTGQVH